MGTSSQLGPQHVRAGSSLDMERQQRVRVLNRRTQISETEGIAFDAGVGMNTLALLPEHPKRRKRVIVVA